MDIAYVEITCVRELYALKRRSQVFINNCFMGVLKRRQKMVIEVPAGTHTLIAMNKGVTTAPLQLSVQPGDTLSYELRGRRDHSLTFTKK
ncbi:hypothetical protein [Shouchella lonarensis]|uniref:PEGA domain-containing protein n=1 Tax=Shouchella lonarensis TaxID=1464122 RepID=A0A1G6H2B1_9BACI|nr:hypothetical protein [Shouchella lonarensis]SDB88440.1 hypothetical protein SAMN05421737_102274 [Shouchella lonarensis]